MTLPSLTKDCLQNKVILVTGAGSGIGAAAARAYAGLGATVILLGRTVAKLEAVYDEIVVAGHPEPAIIPLDLEGATRQHYRDMANTIRDQFGKLDGLLHNASLLGQLQPFEFISETEFNQVMQVNLNSSVAMTQALLPVLKQAPLASVIFTSSGVGLKGRAFWGSYAISKFATQGMMETLADEYENTQLRFNSINPGKTRTSMRASAFPAEDPGGLPTPEQHMPLYCYLMADNSQDQNGQTFNAADYLGA